jgi:hypothetical protein
MKGITKYLLILLFSAACRGQGEVLSTKELKFEFENVWWEAVVNPFAEGGTMCVIFDPDREVDPPADGKVLYYTEDVYWLTTLSAFERIPDGYYLPYYDVEIEILADDDGIYTAKVKSGLFSQKSEIIPCSLGV